MRIGGEHKMKWKITYIDGTKLKLVNVIGDFALVIAIIQSELYCSETLIKIERIPEEA